MSSSRLVLLAVALLVIGGITAYAVSSGRPPASPSTTPSTGSTVLSDAASDSTPVERRVAQVAALVSGGAIDVTELFAPGFLAKVPADRVLGLSQQIRSELGVVTSSVRTEEEGGLAGKWRFHHAKGYATPVTISVEPSAPHRVVGLLFSPPVRLAASLEDVATELRGLPGQVSFLVARVEDAPGAAGATAATTGGRLVPLAQVEPDRALAIGSAFKLWILAEIVRQVEVGERRWADVVPLDEARRSLPSGILHTWPVGTPVTVQTLASLMISQSDNTATDELLYLAGRERVEAVQRTTGHASPERNVPFLATRELFALKSPAGRALAARWVAGDTAARRAVLAEVARLAREALAPDLASPNQIDRLEWFASANDLARVMLWLRDHTATPRTAPARALMAINPGLALERGSFPYVGYKGGSEPGVLDMTFLLQDAKGRWLICTATWNDPRADVDAARLAGLVQRAIELAASS